jgi:hypothetical protein
VERVPLTLGGRAEFMVANVLAACAVAFVQGVTLERIRAGLLSFCASPHHTPGRMNLDLGQNSVAEAHLAESHLSTDTEVQMVQESLLQPGLKQSSGDLKIPAQVTKSESISPAPEHWVPATLEENSYSTTPLINSLPMVQSDLPTPSANGTNGQTSKRQPVLQAQTSQASFSGGRDTSTAVPAFKGIEPLIDPEKQLNSVRGFTHQVKRRGVAIGTVVFAIGRAVVRAAIEKSAGIRAIAQKKFEKMTQLIDPAILDPALQDALDLFGIDGRFESEDFSFQQTKVGVDVCLKDGTPVYINQKLNLEVDGRFVYRLSHLPEAIAKAKANVDSQAPVQDLKRMLIQSPAIGR